MPGSRSSQALFIRFYLCYIYSIFVPISCSYIIIFNSLYFLMHLVVVLFAQEEGIFQNTIFVFFLSFYFYLILIFLYRVLFCISRFYLYLQLFLSCTLLHSSLLNVQKPSFLVRFCFPCILSSLLSMYTRVVISSSFPLQRRGRSKGSQIFILCNLAM